MPDSDDAVFVALYTDADVHGDLANLIRKRGFDARSAYEETNAYLSDEQQLEYAATQGRALLTHNARDFEPLYRQWWEAERHHSGVIISQKLGIGEMLRRVLRLLNRVPAEEMRDNIKNLAEFSDGTN